MKRTYNIKDAYPQSTKKTGLLKEIIDKKVKIRKVVYAVKVDDNYKTLSFTLEDANSMYITLDNKLVIVLKGNDQVETDQFNQEKLRKIKLERISKSNAMKNRVN